MKKLLVLLCLGFVLVGCKSDEEKAIDFGKNAISEELYDADSAKFKDLKFYPSKTSDHQIDGGYVCGQVNAKNLLGAYVGFNSFYVQILKAEDDFIYIWGERQPSNPIEKERFLIAYEEHCRDSVLEK